MGLSARAELIWGIPVVAYDESTGESTEFWDEEREDWRKFDGEIYVEGFGHYQDPDNKRGILTSKRVETYSGDCWEPTYINGNFELVVSDKVYSKSEDQARAAGLSVRFYESASWWLVASYG